MTAMHKQGTSTMIDIDKSRLSRRALLAGAGASAVPGIMPGLAHAQAGGTIKLTAWSAAVDQVKSHASAFEKATGIKVAYENFPWAQYRTSVVTRLVGNADMDVLWVSDAWLPEFAEAGWLAPINDEAALMKYNAEAAAYCTQSMTYKGKQYGLAYYGDHMSFMYNTEILQKAGISAPPTTWDEVVQQSLKIKQSGGPEFPLLLSLATDTWLIEFVSALTFSHGGRFVDGNGDAIMADPAKGAVEAATFVRDAIHKHKIVSPSAVETTEINGLKAIGSGQFAFGIVPTYRMRALNDPSQATAAGKIRPALMPKGAKATDNATCGWIRFYGLTPGGQGQRHAPRQRRQADGVLRRQGHRRQVHACRSYCYRTSVCRSAPSRSPRMPTSRHSGTSGPDRAAARRSPSRPRWPSRRTPSRRGSASGTRPTTRSGSRSSWPT